MLKLFKAAAANDSKAKKEKPVSSFIPYKCHWDKNTIITKSNGLLQVIKIGGFSFETADDIDLDIRKNIRNSMFKNMASGNITLYFHTIRRKKAVLQFGDNFDVDPTNITAKDFISYLETEWRAKNAHSDSYFNELYVSILYEPDKEGAAAIEYFLNKIRQKSDKSIWENDMREMHENIQEMTNRMLNTFRDYDAKLLGIKKTKNGNFCEISEFLGVLINCGDTTSMMVTRGKLDNYLPTNRLFFGSRSMESRGPRGRKYAGIVSVREYGPSTSAGVFDGFLQMPFEFVMTQSFVFSNRTIAINKMQLQQNRMIQSEDKAVSQIAEISQALDMAMSGEIGFGEHHISVLCIDSDLKALENSLSMASVEFSNCGMQPVREKVNMEPTYWGQLPGNISYIIRRSVINTLNLSGFASMHNYPLGKISGNHWGDYVTVLDTTSGTPFYFNYHLIANPIRFRTVV